MSLQSNMGSSISLHRLDTRRATVSQNGLFKQVRTFLGKRKLTESIFSLVARLPKHSHRPAQMLMGRRFRTQLPTTPTLLESYYPTENIKKGLSRRTEMQQQYYNQNAKVLKLLDVGDTVRVRKLGQKIWTPAVVTKVTEAPRSYVADSEGTSYRRKRRDVIKPTEGTKQQQGTEVPETNTISPVHLPVSSEKVSSDGRIIRPPVWVKDYVTN